MRRSELEKLAGAYTRRTQRRIQYLSTSPGKSFSPNCMAGNVIVAPDTTSQAEHNRVTGTAHYGEKRAADVDVKDMISRVHKHIHTGIVYTTSYLLEVLGNNNSLDIGITLGANYTNHIGISVDAGGDALFYIYEAPTYTGGTTLTAYNNNRASGNTTESTIVHTPSVSAVGTPIYQSIITGGTKTHATGGSDGGLARGGAEWVLAKSTLYLLRLTNKAGSDKNAGIAFTYYEE